MNLRFLETFLCVAECLSFRRAAELLHRSQAAISAHVQQLEEELGVPLFDRTTRRVALTAEGRTLLARSKSVVAELRATADELREASGIRGGVIDVGVSPSLAATRLPPALAQFTALYPGVTVRVHEAVARTLYEDIRQRRTDFAIGPAVPGLKDFDYQVFAREPLLAVLPTQYPLRGRTSIGFKEVLQQPFISVPVGNYLRRLLEDTAREAGVVFAPRFELASFAAVLAQVEAGVGVSIVPPQAIATGRDRAMTVLPVSSPTLAWSSCILKLKGKRLPPPAARLANLLFAGAGWSAAEGLGSPPT